MRHLTEKYFYDKFKLPKWRMFVYRRATMSTQETATMATMMHELAEGYTERQRAAKIDPARKEQFIRKTITKILACIKANAEHGGHEISFPFFWMMPDTRKIYPNARHQSAATHTEEDLIMVMKEEGNLQVARALENRARSRNLSFLSEVEQDELGKEVVKRLRALEYKVVFIDLLAVDHEWPSILGNSFSYSSETISYEELSHRLAGTELHAVKRDLERWEFYINW